MNALDAVRKLGEAQKLRHVDGPGQFHAEMVRANLAIVTYNTQAANHFEALVEALQVKPCGHTDYHEPIRDCGHPSCRRCAILAAVQRDAEEAMT